MSVPPCHSDISEAYPAGEFSHYFRSDWLTAMCRETRANKEFQPRTQETARWAREQIKRQAGEDLPRCDVSTHRERSPEGMNVNHADEAHLFEEDLVVHTNHLRRSPPTPERSPPRPDPEGMRSPPSSPDLPSLETEALPGLDGLLR